MRFCTPWRRKIRLCSSFSRNSALCKGSQATRATERPRGSSIGQPRSTGDFAPNRRRNNLMNPVANTARWTAAIRALETERPDRLFEDPLARALADEEGFRLLGPSGPHLKDVG